MTDILDRIAYAIETVTKRHHALMTIPVNEEHDVDCVLAACADEIRGLRAELSESRGDESEYLRRAEEAEENAAKADRVDLGITRLERDAGHRWMVTMLHGETITFCGHCGVRYRTHREIGGER